MSGSAEQARERLENAMGMLARARKTQELVALRLRNAAGRGMGELLRPAAQDATDVTRWIEKAQAELGALWNGHHYWG